MDSLWGRVIFGLEYQLTLKFNYDILEREIENIEEL